MPGPYSQYRGGGGGMPGGYAELLMEPGRAMGQGLADMGRSIGRALEVRKEKEKQANLDVNAADTFMKAVANRKDAEGNPLPNPSGLSLDEYLAKSRDDRIGIAKGMTRFAVFQEEMARQEEQRKLNAMRLQEAAQQQAANQALERARRAATTERGMAMLPGSTTDVMLPGSTPFQGIPSQVETQVPLTSGRLLQAIGQEQGAINRENLPEVLRLAAMVEGQAGLPYMPEPFNVGGMEGIVSPKTGGVFLKSRPGGRTFEQDLELLSQRQLGDLRTALIAAKSRAYTDKEKADYQAQLDAVEKKFKEGTGQKTNGGEGAAATPPLVTSEAEYNALASGALYKDGLGNIRRKR